MLDKTKMRTGGWRMLVLPVLVFILALTASGVLAGQLIANTSTVQQSSIAITANRDAPAGQANSISVFAKGPVTGGAVQRPKSPNDDAFAFFAQGGSNCSAPVTTVTIVGTAPPEPIELCINAGMHENLTGQQSYLLFDFTHLNN